MARIILLLLLSCTIASAQQNVTYVITNVNVIPMDTETVLQNQTVIVEGGKISSISSSKQIPRGAVTIDANGQYIIPGLAEMHAHIPSARGQEYTEEVLFLYLSNGITTIRGMLGAPEHLKLREDVRKGEVLGPRIYTSSPSMNGNSIPTEEEAIRRVRKYQQDGYDFLKIHPGIKREVFDAMVATAKEVGMGYSGHVPLDVGVRHALASGYGTIDHVDGYVEGLVPQSSGLDPQSGGFFGFNFTDKVDTSLLPELIQLTKENDVWIVPTQSLMERWAGDRPGSELVQEPAMRYVSASTRNSWVNAVENFQSGPNFSLSKASKFNALRRDIIRQLHDAGVGILLGSDAPQVFNVPGFSIQHELEYMVQSGLSTYETLRTGTTNPASFLGAEGEFGILKEGMSADFVMVKTNPLSEIDAMKNPSGVMVRGKWLSRETIDKRLQEIANRYKN